MKKILIVLMVLLMAGCSGNQTPAKEIKNTRQESIFDTTYSVPEEWLIEDSGDNSKIIYFQNEKPESIDDAIVVVIFKNVMENGVFYPQSEYYINLLKDSMLDNLFKERKSLQEEKYNKTKTAGYHTVTDMTNGMRDDTYYFMNSFTDAVMITYYHNNERGQDYTKEVKDFVDSMEFSFEGFRSVNKPSSASKKADTSSSSGGEQYYKGSEWEAYDHDKDGKINDYEFQDALSGWMEKNFYSYSPSSGGEKYKKGSEWEKYDHNKDGLISDSEWDDAINGWMENNGW